MKKWLVTGVVLNLIFVGCSDKSNNLGNQYFDYDSVLLAQQNRLVEQSKKLEKEIILDGERDIITTKPSNKEWESEFKKLADLDPNQTRYVNAFEADTMVSDLEMIYQLSPSGKAKVPLRSLKVLISDKEIRSIEGRVAEENWVYREEKRIKLDFEDNDLVRFEISGGQKMISNDSTSYQIVGLIKN